ncbi:MAG TPA: sulfurtransferase [Gammaproteobacteria bacterium]|nr:sulfurtransferase [Gammaproteobacteria bacterium]
MTMDKLPLLLEPDQLEANLGRDDLLVVDLSRPETYAKFHVPGAVHLDYARIITAEKPVMGLVPDDATLTAVFSAIGIDARTHVVASDDEGGGRAARLLWTLEVAGHNRVSLLNGGLHAWVNEGHPIESAPVTPVDRVFEVHRDPEPVADSSYIKAHLDSDDTVLLDARSPDEYNGVKKFADRAGHIPGAVHFEWTEAMDQGRNLRLKPADELRQLLAERGITPDKEVIAYCQTHHRSAHTCLALQSLGFERVKGYAGSWSDWGNNPDLPLEV